MLLNIEDSEEGRSVKNSFEKCVYTSDRVSTSYFRYTSLWECHVGRLYFDISIHVYNASVLITFCFYQSTVLKMNYVFVTVLSSIFKALLPMTPSDVFQWDISHKCTFCTLLTGESSQWIDILWVSAEKRIELFCQECRFIMEVSGARRGDTLTGVRYRDKWLRPRLNVTYFRHALFEYNRWSTSCVCLHESAQLRCGT